MCCARLAENTGHKDYAKNRHLCSIVQLCWAISSEQRHVSTIGKKLVKWQYLFHMSLQFGELHPLTSEICWRVWGTPANFNGFCVLALLLQWHCSTEVNQTLHDVWPSPALVYCIYIFGGSCPLTEFCQLQNSLCIQVLHSPILAALLHDSWASAFSQTVAWY